MEIVHLSDTVSVKKVSETPNEGEFEIEGLYSGYGLTVGNALRRVLLSSLPGAAVTQYKIKGINHEFTTVPNVLEDVVEIGLNLKKIRFRAHTNEPQVLKLRASGEKKITAKDIEPNPQMEIMNPDAEIATLTSRNAELEMEITAERGLGYVAVESRKFEKMSIGTIPLDAFFSPVTRVNFSVENMRVGDRTDYNRLKIGIQTDGTVTPSAALHKAGNVLKDHFDKISGIEVLAAEIAEEMPGRKKAKKKIAKKIAKKKTAKKTSKKK